MKAFTVVIYFSSSPRSLTPARFSCQTTVGGSETTIICTLFAPPRSLTPAIFVCFVCQITGGRN